MFLGAPRIVYERLYAPWLCNSQFPPLFSSRAFHTLFPIPVLGMGGDLWMRPLGPVAPEGATWMHFPSVTAALRHLHSPAGDSLKKLQHTQVTRAAKSNATRDGWAFTMDNPSLLNPGVAAPSPSPTPSQSAARSQPLTLFFLAAVRCACCSINICGAKCTRNRRLRVVDEACMQVVGSTVHCFSCTCRARGNELPSHTVECHGCHFRMYWDGTTDGICTRCAERNPPRERALKARKFNQKTYGSSGTSPKMNSNAEPTHKSCLPKYMGVFTGGGGVIPTKSGRFFSSCRFSQKCRSLGGGMFTFLKSPRNGHFGKVWVWGGVGGRWPYFFVPDPNFLVFWCCSNKLVWSGVVWKRGFTVLGPVLQYVVSMANFSDNGK